MSKPSPLRDALALALALAAAVSLGLARFSYALARGDLALCGLRAATGVASAASFVGGGLLAARLAGRVADGPGGLLGGLAIRAGVLALGSLLAMLQRPLTLRAR